MIDKKSGGWVSDGTDSAMSGLNLTEAREMDARGAGRLQEDRAEIYGGERQQAGATRKSRHIAGSIEASAYSRGVKSLV